MNVPDVWDPGSPQNRERTRESWRQVRGLLMESEGYRTRVFEFISDAHTHRNAMIAGVREMQAFGRQRAGRNVCDHPVA